MACPKVNPNYPSTAVRLPEIPLDVLCRRADPDFDKVRRRDPSYKFGRRQFVTDPMSSGAYGVTVAGIDAGYDAGAPAGSEFFLTLGAQDAVFAPGGFDGEFGPGFYVGGYLPQLDPAYRDQVVAAIDAQFRADNGFCDPLVDGGTITTGTGAGGRNPGTVPSRNGDAGPDAGLDALDIFTAGARFYGGIPGDDGFPVNPAVD